MSPAGRVDYEGRDLEAMACAENYHRWIASGFRPHLGRRIVEVGAGCGNFTSHLLETRPEWIIAVEPSPQMCERLRARHGGKPCVRVVEGYAEDALATCPTAPDTLVYVNVLEHVDDDRKELATAFRGLAPGGALCVLVPALPGLYGPFDQAVGHRRRYRKGELEEKITGVGFQLVQSRYFDLLGVIPWWIVYRLLRRSALRPGDVSLYDRLCVPVTRAIERICPPPVGKNVFLVARRPEPAHPCGGWP